MHLHMNKNDNLMSGLRLVVLASHAGLKICLLQDAPVWLRIWQPKPGVLDQCESMAQLPEGKEYSHLEEIAVLLCSDFVLIESS